MLASPEGRRKLRRILKCWVAVNSDLTYWQGMCYFELCVMLSTTRLAGSCVACVWMWIDLCVTDEGVCWTLGVDSLCAPFLTLHFNSEATAFGCLHRLVQSHLRPLFEINNPAGLQSEVREAPPQVLAFEGQWLTCSCLFGSVGEWFLLYSYAAIPGCWRITIPNWRCM